MGNAPKRMGMTTASGKGYRGNVGNADRNDDSNLPNNISTSRDQQQLNKAAGHNQSSSLMMMKNPKPSSELIQSIIDKGPATTEYNFNVKDVLGRGHYAVVNLATHKQTGEQRALKRIQLSKSRREALWQEIQVLMTIGMPPSVHPNIVALYDVFITDTEVQLVMELLRGGELFDRMVEKGPYSEAEASAHVRKIGDALQYLHSHGVVHRDLKPENLILVDKSDNAELKIADFGLSKIVEDLENTMMQTVCGTWAYAAPEVKTSTKSGTGRGAAAYSYKVDMWSLGVILFVILSAYHPFDPEGECSDGELWKNICSGVFDFNDPAWDYISDAAKDLIRHLIVLDPKKRYGTKELLAHPWVSRRSNVPATPITPVIDSKMRDFQEKRRNQGTTPGRFMPNIHFVAPPTPVLKVPNHPPGAAAAQSNKKFDRDGDVSME